jgi:hypothetical protein
MPGAIADLATLGCPRRAQPGSFERSKEAKDALEVSIHMSSLCSESLVASGDIDVFLDQAQPILKS